MEKLEKNKFKKGGYAAIEFIFGLTIIIMTMLIMVGLFAYTYPRQYLEKEVANLAQQAKVNGGLTQENIMDFRDRIGDMGMDAQIACYTPTTSALNVAPRGTAHGVCTTQYNPFITRKSGQTMTIEVVVSASDGLVKGPLAFFGGKALPDRYTLVETVMSERNKC